MLKECDFSKSNFNRLSLKIKNILPEQNEVYLDHIKIEEESFIEKISNEENRKWYLPWKFFE